MKFANKMKMYRQENNWTQQKVAEELRISRKTVSSWENGRSYPDVFMLTQISDLYQVSLDDLLREDHEMINSYKEEHKSNTRKDNLFRIAYIINVVGCVYFLLQSLGTLNYVRVFGQSAEVIMGVLTAIFSLNILWLLVESDFKKSRHNLIGIVMTIIVLSLLLMRLDHYTLGISNESHSNLYDFVAGYIVAMKTWALTGLIWLYPQFKKLQKRVR